ncbi:uncharacterized protein [Dysidea avara]
MSLVPAAAPDHVITWCPINEDSGKELVYELKMENVSSLFSPNNDSCSMNVDDTMAQNDTADEDHMIVIELMFKDVTIGHHVKLQVVSEEDLLVTVNQAGVCESETRESCNKLSC